MLPNFIGLGAPKSATTWLYHCLREHPEVFVADSKEVMFFDYGDIRGRLETYEKHFKWAGDAKAIGEFSTRYLASTRAPAPSRRMEAHETGTKVRDCISALAPHFQAVPPPGV